MYRYKTILVGTDFTDRSNVAVKMATALADRVAAERIHLVHVAHVHYPIVSAPFPELPPATVSDDVVKELIADSRERIEGVAMPATKAEVIREVRRGTPALELVQAADEAKADLIMVNSRHHGGVKKFFLGSVAGALVRASHCPVFVLREDQPVPSRIARVVAAVDLSDVSAKVLANAVAMAAPAGGKIEVMSVYEKPLLAQRVPSADTPDVELDAAAAYRALVDRLLDEVERGDVDVELRLVEGGPPARTILDAIDDNPPDLLVFGSSGHNAWHRALLGSTAMRLLDSAPCPVLVVPHDSRTPTDDAWLAPTRRSL